jgi:hypothetical protein
LLINGSFRMLSGAGTGSLMKVLDIKFWLDHEEFSFVVVYSTKMGEAAVVLSFGDLDSLISNLLCIII